MSKSNRRIRERRRARRQAAGAGTVPSGRDLIPHTRRCPCRQCEAGRHKALARAIGEQDKRLSKYESGHVCPEHRDGWRISPNRSSDWMAMHDVTRSRRGKLCRVEMRPEWLTHLDGLLVEQGLALLHDLRPLWARLVVSCVVEGQRPAEVARVEGLHRSTVGRHLRAALLVLKDLCLAEGTEDDPHGSQRWDTEPADAAVVQ